MDGGASFIPLQLRDDGLGIEGDGIPRRPNLSPAAHRYLESLDASVEDLFHHILAVLHDPTYREANAGALRMEWPRIPLPGWPNGSQDGAANELAASAARGRQLAALLDSDTPVPGVTEPIPGAPPTRVGIQDQGQPSFRRRPESRGEGRGGDGDHPKYLPLLAGASSGSALRPEIAAVAVPSTTDGGNMTPDDFALTAGWGHFGSGQAVMPGQGPRHRARIHDGRARRPRRRHPDPRRHHLRHLPKRQSLLAQHPVQRLDLQTRRLPGPQKVALLPRPQSPSPPPPPPRSPTPNQHHPPHNRNPIAGDGVKAWVGIATATDAIDQGTVVVRGSQSGQLP